MNPTNNRNLFLLKSQLAIFVGLWAVTGFVFSLEPPTPEQMQRYREDGTLFQRIEDARAFENHRMDPQLIQRMNDKIKAQILKKNGVHSAKEKMTPPLGWQGMPSVGDVKLFILLLSFSDYPETETTNAIEGSVFGQGRPSNFPTESLREFYLRSSYDQLDLQGSVFEWYRTPYPRSSVIENMEGRQAVIKEALLHQDQQGHDFSQYDNDGDGDIDYFAVIWTGPVGEWAEFWWGYQTHFYDASFSLDGKTFSKYSWQWQSFSYPDGQFSPGVLIHETGHALGLPDYYDYDDDVGPRGGVGGMDMMDGYGDHNCFSKFVLDWIEPEFLSSGSPQITLGRSSSNPDALLIMPTQDESISLFEEYFMVQNRNRNGNDTVFPADGLLIWHVDARIDGWSYLNDNSYTDHKLLRLMEADGLEQIEQGQGADSGDFYIAGSEFSPDATPDSTRYNGDSSGVFVKDISNPAASMNFNAGIQELPQVRFTDKADGDWICGPIVASVDASHSAGISQVEFWLDDSLLGKDTVAPFTIAFDLVEYVAMGDHRLRAIAESSNGMKVSEEITIRLIRPGNNVIVVDLASDNESGDRIGRSLSALGFNPVFLDSVLDIQKNISSLAFICLGYSRGRYELTQSDSDHLVNYLRQGNSLYVEGGETWAFDTRREIQDMCGIVGLSDGLAGPFSTIVGVDGTWTQGMTIQGEGISDWVDWLAVSDQVQDAYAIWNHANPQYVCGIVRDNGTFKTIGSSFEFGNIPESDRNSVMEAYLDFFEQSRIVPVPVEFPVPHIAGLDWQSSLTVINATEQWALLTLEKYGVNGGLTKTDNLAIRPLMELTLTASELGTDGIARLLAYGEDLSVKLSFRYGESTSLSDFFLDPDQRATQYVIPNTIKDWFDWFGVAIANFDSQDLNVELMAYKNGLLLSSSQLQLTSFSKHVGLSTQIWEGLQYQDVDMVVVASDRPLVPPISITGNFQQDRHVFFQGHSVDDQGTGQTRVLIPHIAGSAWTTSVTAYNHLGETVDMDLTIRDQAGTPILSHHEIQAHSALELLSGRDFEPDSLGEMTCDVAVPVKVSYRFGDSFSLAEFFVSHKMGRRWLIPNPRHDWFQWFGFAVANVEEETVRVNLEAFQTGIRIGTSSVDLLPFSKIVQTSQQAWDLTYSEVDFLLVEADREIAFPISITGTNEQDRHLFFVAQPLSSPQEGDRK